MTYPSGLAVSYSRDAGGQISGINLNGAPLVTNISRLPFGPLKTAALGSVNLTRSYDQRYNVTGIKAGSLDYTYSRDAAGHVTGITGIQPPATSGEVIDYSYNPANNQLTTAAPKSYSYDATGNMVSDGISTFTWDGLNRLIKVEKAGATVATYGYDAANRRIRKTVGAVTTHYLYDLNNQLIAETLVDGTILREYIYLDGEPLALKEYQTNPGTYYFINDHLGTPQQLVTSTGAVVWQAAYLPFGQAQIKTATVANNLRFPGQYFDAETGLHYNWNRYYDPEVGRYVSADPIGLDGGMNLYGYVEGNPVNWIDPYGLFLEEMDIGITVGPLDTWSIRDTPDTARSESERLRISMGFAASSRWGGEADALRHAIWLCEMSKLIGREQALKVGAVHERHNPAPTIAKPPKNYKSVNAWQQDDTAMDNHNNMVGSKLGNCQEDDFDCSKAAKSALKEGLLKVNSPGGYKF